MAKIPTFDDWASSETRRAALQKLLDDPILQDAFATLTHAFQESTPTMISTDATPGHVPCAADLNNLLALRATHRAGFFGAFRALHNLAKDKPLRPNKDPRIREFVPVDDKPARNKPKS